MSDIIVTTPKSRMDEARAEAETCIREGGGLYFRRFNPKNHPRLHRGDRVYYVEDGFVRGFAVVVKVEMKSTGQACQATGRRYEPGFYVFMDSTTWTWIKPIPMLGFPGWRYAKRLLQDRVEEIGDWLMAKPEVSKFSGKGRSGYK